MSLKIAFVGFRHGHINALHSLLRERDDVEIVASCEEDADARAALQDSPVAITHDSYKTMLSEVDCDVVACGDYYGIRGERLIAALEAGKHIVGDKPLCTDLAELDRIEALSHSKGLRVGCMLDLNDADVFQTVRQLILDDTIGEVHSIHFDGQHPLNYGNRPMWYFEEGKHGGTINDLAIHGIDGIPYFTGRQIVEVTAARVWNARHREHPWFQDGAVLMMRLDNGGAVTGDVSYLTPEGPGYTMPCYWRFDISGTDGRIETSATMKRVMVYRRNEKAGYEAPLVSTRQHGYWEDFEADLAGTPSAEGLTTARVIRSARIALTAQHAAESGTFPVTID
ncbi:MAG: Gfo/Idh/MocA family oxidoreductase [bacterium]|nr:Gfo/Idh/MocA family oxidoreductase [bacterium]